MRSIFRYRIYALALLLAVSQLALAGHDGAHVTPDLEQCELCVSQAQPLTAALPALHAVVTELQRFTARFLSLTCIISRRQAQPYHQRAPPEIL
jgi:hypothetical protein